MRELQFEDEVEVEGVQAQLGVEERDGYE